jgi:hypothetical protein
VRSPSCRAKVVFPLPAQPKMTIRTMIVRLPQDLRDSQMHPPSTATRHSAQSGRTTCDDGTSSQDLATGGAPFFGPRSASRNHILGSGAREVKM